MSFLDILGGGVTTKNTYISFTYEYNHMTYEVYGEAVEVEKRQTQKSDHSLVEIVVRFCGSLELRYFYGLDELVNTQREFHSEHNGYMAFLDFKPLRRQHDYSFSDVRLERREQDYLHPLQWGGGYPHPECGNEPSDDEYQDAWEKFYLKLYFGERSEERFDALEVNERVAKQVAFQEAFTKHWLSNHPTPLSNTEANIRIANGTFDVNESIAALVFPYVTNIRDRLTLACVSRVWRNVVAKRKEANLKAMREKVEVLVARERRLKMVDIKRRVEYACPHEAILTALRERIIQEGVIIDSSIGLELMTPEEVRKMREEAEDSSSWEEPSAEDLGYEDHLFQDGNLHYVEGHIRGAI